MGNHNKLVVKITSHDLKLFVCNCCGHRVLGIVGVYSYVFITCGISRLVFVGTKHVMDIDVFIS